MWEFFVPYCFSCLFHSLIPWSCTELTVKRNRLGVLRRLGDVPALRALAGQLGLLTSHRPDDDARPHGLSPAAARRVATVALVFLLRALDLPVPELPLVEVEGCQGNEDDPHEHGHQNEERERGGERGEDAELFRAGAVVGLEEPVAAAHRHRQPRGLGGSGCHPVHVVSLTPVPFVLTGLSAVTPARACGLPAPKRRHMSSKPETHKPLPPALISTNLEQLTRKTCTSWQQITLMIERGDFPPGKRTLLCM